MSGDFAKWSGRESKRGACGFRETRFAITACAYKQRTCFAGPDPMSRSSAQNAGKKSLPSWLFRCPYIRPK